MPDKADPLSGLIVAAHGQRGILESDSGEEKRYVVKGRRLRVVCGDRVYWADQKHGKTVLVSKIQPRGNVLERQPPGHTKTEILAANLTCMVVVLAPMPAPDWFLIDRYLCAAELMGAPYSEGKL